MNQFQGFDNRNNGGGIAGTTAGILCGLGTFIGFESFWWRMGWGIELKNQEEKNIRRIDAASYDFGAGYAGKTDSWG